MIDQTTTFLPPNSPLAIYGAGGFGKKIATVLRENDFRVVCFIDQKAKQGQLISEVPVIRIDQMKDYRFDHIVFGIFNRDVRPQTVIQQLADASDKLSVLSIQQILHASNGSLKSYWLDTHFPYQTHQAKIESCARLFEDTESIELFHSILEYRMSGNLFCSPVGRGLESQYFEPGIEGWLADKTSLVMVDGGAFDGDSIRNGFKYKISFRHVYAFEPEAKNISSLIDTLNAMQVPSTIFPLATWSGLEMLQFDSSGGEAGRINKNSDKMILGSSLDICLPTQDVDLLKLDVEGAEVPTLHGAKKLISRSRPYLALSVYHLPNDLWEIPLLVNSWNLKYKFYLRQHGENGFDTVLYCFPEN